MRGGESGRDRESFRNRPAGRVKRRVLWVFMAGVLLAGVILAAAFLAVWFVPWERYETWFQEGLNRTLPVRIVFDKPTFAWSRGLGVTLKDFRILARGSGEDRDAEILVSHGLVIHPTLSALLKREVRLKLLLDSPVVEVSRVSRIVGEAGRERGSGATRTPLGSTLSGLVPLPAGLTLTGVDLRIRDGTVRAVPTGESGLVSTPVEVRDLAGSFLLRDDLTFVSRIRSGLVEFSSTGEHPLRGSGRFSGRVSGGIPSGDPLHAEAGLRLEGADLCVRGTEVAIPAHLDLSVSRLEVNTGGLKADGLRVHAPGLDVQATAGEIVRTGHTVEVSVRGLHAEATDLRPFLATLPQGTDLAAACSVTAESVSWATGRPDTPAFPGSSFHLRIPGQLSLEGVRARLADGRLRLLSPDSAGNAQRVVLDGLRAEWTQEEASKWTGRFEVASSDILLKAPPEGTHGGIPGGLDAVHSEEPPGKAEQRHWRGPFSLQVQWVESGDASHAVLLADLTGGHLLYGNLLDKPAGIPLQVGARARFEPGEIRVGRAFLDLGETHWQASLSLKDPGDPVVDLELATGTVALDQVAAFSPAAAEHGVRGHAEIQAFRLTGRTRAFKKTATLQARLVGKGLEYDRVAVDRIYAEAVYGQQILTVTPLIVIPEPGSRLEATFTGDFSGAFAALGTQQHFGTVKMEKVALDKIVTLAHPDYAGRVEGLVDANIAGRGTGESWEAVRRSLDARARIYLQDFLVHGEGSRKLVEALAEGDAAGPAPEGLDREQSRLLSGNHAAAWVSLKDETVRVRNLAATYEGKVVEMDGTLDFSGRIQVVRGSLFLRNRQVPFRLNCRVGQGKCTPAPDVKFMGKSAAREAFVGLHTISVGARDVFKDLLF